MARRRRDEVFVGMQIEHQYRYNMLMPEYDWFCTINEIDAKNNELKVSVTSKHGQSHPETWNMEHTVNGLANREYLEITGEVE
jgi:hypothetical protein